MSTFFDLREFLITLLKKFRLSLLIIIVFTLAGGLIRFIPLMQEYLSYDKQVEAAKSMDTASDYPYFYEARRTIYIEPNYITEGNKVIDTSKNVAQAYQECYQNKEILQPLVDEYFEEASKLYYKNQEQQIKYQFINRSASTDFMLQDFYKWITISISNNFVDLKVKSPDINFSEKVVGGFEELLSNYVRELIGEYYYQVTDGQIGTSVPADTTGVVLKPTVNTIQEQNSLSFILIKSIKGCIWGFGGGIIISLILCFFYYSVSPLIYEEEDLKSFQLPILASVSDTTEGKSLIADRIIAFLRGNTAEFCNYTDCGKVISALLSSKDKNDCIAISGSCNHELIKKISEAMSGEGSDLKIIPVKNLVYSPEAIKAMENINSILLIEKLNESSKVEIQREIDRAHYLEKNILGFIIIR